MGKTTATAPDPEIKQKTATPMEAEMGDEQGDIVLVEKAYLYITKGNYPKEQQRMRKGALGGKPSG